MTTLDLEEATSDIIPNAHYQPLARSFTVMSRAVKEEKLSTFHMFTVMSKSSHQRNVHCKEQIRFLSDVHCDQQMQEKRGQGR